MREFIFNLIQGQAEKSVKPYTAAELAAMTGDPMAAYRYRDMQYGVIGAVLKQAQQALNAIAEDDPDAANEALESALDALSNWREAM